MDDISLHKFLLSVPSVMSIIFPREAERHIAGAELKSLMTYDGWKIPMKMKEHLAFSLGTSMNLSQEQRVS